MSTRREFLGATGLAASFVVLKRRMPWSSYTPAGYISVGNPVARNVMAVTLDGKKMTHVFEADDIEGWLTRYTDPLGAENGIIRQERLTGRVEFIWRTK